MEGLLLDPIMNEPSHEENAMAAEKRVYIDFISKLEGYKTRCKNLHWASVKKNIHVYLDEFLDIMSDYQDSLAEESMGICGHLSALDISGTMCSAQTAKEFIREVIDNTIDFYKQIPDKPCHAGLKSECETFIHNCWKYKYLFELSAQDVSY